MNKEMLDLTSWVIKATRAAGADNCKVNLDSNRSVEISYRDRRPENIKEASTKALNIEIYVNGRFSQQSTSDLQKRGSPGFHRQRRRGHETAGRRPSAHPSRPQIFTRDRADLDLELVDPAYKSLTPENRHEMVKAMETACLKEGGDKVVSVTAQEQDGYQESLQMTSNGFAGFAQGTYYSVFAEMTAKDEGDRRPNGYSYAVAVSRKDLPKPEVVGIQAAQRTLSMLGARKIKTETLPVIIENQNVGRIFGGFLAAMSGRSIQQKRSFLADKKGQPVASKHLTLIDDPFIKGGLGSRLFDSDGFSARKRTLIEAGVLKEFFIDWYYSRKLGWEPTSGSAANLVIPPGQRSVKEIMKDLGRGILINGFIGGNSNPTTGDMSIGITGHLFENGEPVQAVAEMNIADNHLEILEQADRGGQRPVHVVVAAFSQPGIRERRGFRVVTASVSRSGRRRDLWFAAPPPALSARRSCSPGLRIRLTEKALERFFAFRRPAFLDEDTQPRCLGVLRSPAQRPAHAPGAQGAERFADQNQDIAELGAQALGKQHRHSGIAQRLFQSGMHVALARGQLGLQPGPKKHGVHVVQHEPAAFAFSLSSTSSSMSKRAERTASVSYASPARPMIWPSSRYFRSPRDDLAGLRVAEVLA